MSQQCNPHIFILTVNLSATSLSSDITVLFHIFHDSNMHKDNVIVPFDPMDNP
jgi:hypothetical protein